MAKYKYGWKRDIPDIRDHVFALTREEQLASLPLEYSLRTLMPPVYDQGQLGSCTANSIGGAVQYQQMKQAEAEGSHTPSRLFIYWNERKIEGTIDSDSGAQIRDGMKVIANVGAPPETDWPYIIQKFAETPPSHAFADAIKYKAVTYGRVTQSATALKTSIFHARPVVFGFTVFESFETEIGSDGIMPIPNFQTESVLGGHAVMTIGYKLINNQLYFECRNSWGSSWGDHGYFWMPAEYIIEPQLANDFWHIKLES